MNALKRLTMMVSLLTGILLTLSLSYGSQAATAVSNHPVAPLQIVLNHLEQNRAQYGLVAADLSDYMLTDMYQSEGTGVTHLYLRQRVNGIEVWTGNLSAHVLPDGSILALHSAFMPHVDRASYTGQPALTAAEALNTAAQERRWPITSYFTAEQQLGGADQRQILSTGGVAVDPIPAKLVYVVDDQGALTLAWEAILQPIHTSDWWHMAIDATTGQVLEQYNWTVSHDERLSFMEQRGGGAEEQRGGVARLTLEPSHSPLAGSYRVFPLPYESPTAPGATHILVSDPDDSTASPFGWHDTDGVIGAELTTTEGNNVHAYTDTNGDNNPDPGSSPDGGAGLLFDFAFDPSQPPPNGTNPQAAVVNLFYWTNVAHDILYRHGFTEASGNYQTNNYGNGGLGNDSLRAEAQDGSGTNGGNFSTPPDGGRPRMQMFRWTITTPHRDGAFDAGIVVHEYGHGWSNRLTGGPSNVSCLQNSEQMGEGWSDYLTLVATAQISDTRTTTRSIGTYVLGQPPTGAGFRPHPYTTDMGVNPHTYANTLTAAVPHGIGSIWAAMLWEVYWNLVDAYGFNPNLYQDSTTGGNNLALRLVSDGLKLQPCSPGFVTGRNAILAADIALTGGANQCLIWQGFAKRGLGFSASQGSANSNADNVAAFDMPLSCQSLNATPLSQDVCQGTAAVYTLTASGAFTGSVQLSAVGNPSPSMVDFSINPITAPGSSEMTIDNTGGVAVGNYTITATGDDGIWADSAEVELNILAGAPHTPTLTTPANNTTGVGLTPTLGWSAVAETDEYTVEIATDAGFGNLVYTATVATASHPVGASLSEATTYFWRVTAANGCGTSADSLPFSFTTLVPPTYGVQLSADEAQTAVPSQTITYTVSITNTGDVTDTFELAVGGNTWTTTLSVPSIELAAAEMGSFEVMVAVHAGSWAGDEDVAMVTAVSQTDNAASDTVVLTSTAEAVYSFDWSAETIANEGEAGETITYTIHLTNTGNTTDTYTIALAGHAWATTASPASLLLALGQTADVAVVVVIDGEAIYPATDAVTVGVASEGDGRVSAELVLTTAVAEPNLPPQMAIYLPLVMRP